MENKKFFLQEPCYGEIGQNNLPIKFPYELRELLKYHFPDFKIIEHEEKLQKRGENICAIAALMRAKLFAEVNSYTGKRKEGAMITRERLEHDWAETMAFINDNIPHEKYINFTSFALLGDIKLALMRKFNIDISKYSLEYSGPYPPISMADPIFSHFQRLIFSLFNEFSNDEKYQFLSKSFEFINTSHRGELTEYGKMLVDKVAELIKINYPKLLLPLEEQVEENGNKVTHHIDPAFRFYNSISRETLPEIQKLLQEIAIIIKTIQIPAPQSELQAKKLNPAP